MNLEIQTHNYSASTRVKDHIEERVGKFDKYISRDLNQIRITCLEEKLDKIVELHLRAYGKDFHSRAEADDMLTSVDLACNSMEKQLRRHKSRLTDQRKGSEKPTPLSSAAALEELVRPEMVEDVDEVDEVEEY